MKIFFIIGQNLDNFCTVFQKGRVNGVKETKLTEEKKSWGHSHQRFGKSREVSGMNLLKIFLV